MHKVWTFTARFFAVIFAIAFVSTALLALLLYNIDRRLMNAETYKDILANQQVYDRLPRVLAEQLVMTMDYNPCAVNPLLCENATPEFIDCAMNALGEDRFAVLSTDIEKPSEADLQRLQPCLDQFGADLQTNPDEASGPPPFMKSLDVADWESVIATLFPADELQAMTEQTLDQIFGYLGGQQSTASISLVALKQRIAGPDGLDAILKIIRSQEACTPEQSARMMDVLEGTDGEMLLCKPTEETLATMTPLIQAQLKDYTDGLPDEKVLLNPDSGENSSGPAGGLGGQSRILRFILRASPDLPLLFLLFITLLVVRNPKSWLRWWGIPFFVTGVLSFGIALMAAFVFEEAWISLLASQIPPSFSLGVANLVHDLFRSLSQALLNGIRVSSFLLGLLGLGMWVGSYFIKPKPEPDPQPAPTA